MERTEREQTSDSNKALRTLRTAMLAGAAAIALYALQFSALSQKTAVASVGLMVAGAFLLMGGVLGFIFGIPRTLQQESGGAIKVGASDSLGAGYLANTNLEQISDWLTKMLVGVGLTQLTAMPSHLRAVTSYIAEGIGGGRDASIFALSVLLYFSIIGFLFGYLWTRLFLAGAFRQADQTALGTLSERMERANRDIEEIKKQTKLDAEAQNLVDRQLNPSFELPPAPQPELDEAIAAASPEAKAKIFYQTWKVRGENWRNNKQLMEKTIPIFRALVKSDPDGRYHMNHGQLGFALKDKVTPEWENALTELSCAIDIRGGNKEEGWRYYEFNRAICRINLDEDFRSNQASAPPVRKAIVADLKEAIAHDFTDLVSANENIQAWMQLNQVSMEDIVA
ncbi:hypothetical protein [Hahella sp. NBU794]|uniref:hypothetical protein n=1 Tax=Hahella sp. NBU794 TaxID=3422590 RepID=UPI003D6EF38F